MNIARRKFLKAIGALPFIGQMIAEQQPEELRAELPPPPEEGVQFGPLVNQPVRVWIDNQPHVCQFASFTCDPEFDVKEDEFGLSKFVEKQGPVSSVELQSCTWLPDVDEAFNKTLHIKIKPANENVYYEFNAYTKVVNIDSNTERHKAFSNCEFSVVDEMMVST